MKKFNYISLFSGAGVGCFGFKQQGFDCVATCELLPQRIEIQKANKKCRYESGYIIGDLSKFEIKEKLYSQIELWRDKENLRDIDVIIATPPCQGMSTANYKKGDETKRNSLVVEAISIIKKVKPRIFVFENVSAFLKTKCTDIDGSFVTIGESIDKNLGTEYYIYSKVINFKDYGIPSSRPRTVVVATRKDLINISPLNIFPTRKKEITVREAIGDLPSLEFGEIDRNDLFHSFREYPRYMEEWISRISEGKSAFDNEQEYLPYKIVNGRREILKGAYLGNKFRRLFWDKPCACIATRNDQLASQSTIHPFDNRVLSIREIMRLMTIPDEFKWTLKDENEFTTVTEKKAFLKKNELTIRRCIGEAVPTGILTQIAKKSRDMLEFQEFAEKYYKDKTCLECDNFGNFYIDTFIAEQKLSFVKETGSYYTPQTVVFNTLSSYSFAEGKTLKVLEPSVGLGAFLPQIFTLLQNSEKVELDLCDINAEILDKLKIFLEQFPYDREKFKINFICGDFLLCKSLKSKYDLIVSNPPFFAADKTKLSEYRKINNLTKTKNIFAFFLKRYLTLSDEIITIVPKSFLMATEYDDVRCAAEIFDVVKIVDYGVKYFKEVFVEIISIHLKKNYKKHTVVESKLTGETITHPKKYIFHTKSWLIYRNKWFDNYIKKLELGVFTFFRDRQITNKYLKDSGEIRILRSKNILDDGNIISIEGYDKYIERERLNEFAVSKFLNTRSIIVPNFTYNTRATILPDNCLPNGSIAILTPVNETDINLIDLAYYATDDFREYYSIVKNKAKFTLNIDNNSIYYIGVKKDD